MAADMMVKQSKCNDAVGMQGSVGAVLSSARSKRKQASIIELRIKLDALLKHMLRSALHFVRTCLIR